MQLDAFLKENKDVWKTEAAFWAWVSNGIRKSMWNRNPVKLNFIKKHRVKKPLGVGGGMVWAARCAGCGRWWRMRQLAVDHIQNVGRLRSIEDIPRVIEELILVGEDDIQLLCNHHPLSCHKIKSHAERHNMTIEEAWARKLEISREKKEKERKNANRKGAKDGKCKQSTLGRKPRTRPRT